MEAKQTKSSLSTGPQTGILSNGETVQWKNKTEQAFTKNAFKDAITFLNDVKPWGWVSTDSMDICLPEQLSAMMTYLHNTLAYPENILPYLEIIQYQAMLTQDWCNSNAS